MNFLKPKNNVRNTLPPMTVSNNTRKNVNLPNSSAPLSGGRRRRHRKGSRKAHRKTKKST